MIDRLLNGQSNEINSLKTKIRRAIDDKEILARQKIKIEETFENGRITYAEHNQLLQRCRQLDISYDVIIKDAERKIKGLERKPIRKETARNILGVSTFVLVAVVLVVSLLLGQGTLTGFITGENKYVIDGEFRLDLNEFFEVGDNWTYYSSDAENLDALILDGQLIVTPADGFVGENTVTVYASSGDEMMEEDIVFEVTGGFGVGPAEEINETVEETFDEPPEMLENITEPVVEPVVEEPIVEEPIIEEPIIEPVVEEPVVNETVPEIIPEALPETGMTVDAENKLKLDNKYLGKRTDNGEIELYFDSIEKTADKLILEFHHNSGKTETIYVSQGTLDKGILQPGEKARFEIDLVSGIVPKFRLKAGVQPGFAVEAQYSEVLEIGKTIPSVITNGNYTISDRDDEKLDVEIVKDEGRIDITGLLDEPRINSKIESVEGSLTTEVAAAEPIQMENATITIPKTGKVDVIVECSEMDVENMVCLGSWEKTDIEFTDNGDTITFTVDHFSGYAGAELEIINVQSYPVVDGAWEVGFTTQGTADLIITPVNGTTWSDDSLNSSLYDLKLLSVKCGNNTLPYTWMNNSIVIENYYCNETGYETSKVLTEGEHHLEFKFGNDTDYAHNLAGNASLSCVARLTNCNAGEVDIMRMSAKSDAHAEIVSGTDYPYKLCCEDVYDRNTLVNDSGINILNLSSSTNAHSEVPGTTDYASMVYLGTGPGSYDNLTCSYDSVTGTCTNGKSCVLTISGTTDAHVADCATDPYDLTVCCGFNLNNPTSGTPITRDETLVEDLGGLGDIIEIGADNIVFDCNGHSLSGDGTGVGINLNGYDNIVLKNCYFDIASLTKDINLTGATNVTLDGMNIASFEFTEIADLRVVNSYGEIKFLQNVTQSGSDLSSLIVLGSNSVYVDSGSASGFNVPAYLELAGAGKNVFPQVSTDGVNYQYCDPPQCYLLDNSGSTLIFNVSGFSYYKGGRDPYKGYYDMATDDNISWMGYWPNEDVAYYGVTLDWLDFNGDGYADAVVGGYNNKTGTGEGVVRVFYGPIEKVTDVYFGDKANATFTGIANTVSFLGSCLGSGDVNGDGYDDLLIGAFGYPDESYDGAVYLVLGKSAAYSGSSVISSVANTTFTGDPGQGEVLGLHCDMLDADGDGKDDPLMSSYGTGFSGDGITYLVYGSSFPYAGTTVIGPPGGGAGEAASWTDGGEFETAYIIRRAGDVNGDGYEDFLIGAPYANGQTGKVYLIYGQAAQFNNAYTLSTAANATFTAGGLGGLGLAVASAGDVNKDGYDDFLMAEPFFDSDGLTDNGIIYFFYGGPNTWSGTYDLSDQTNYNASFIGYQNDYHAGQPHNWPSEAPVFLGGTLSYGDFNMDTYSDFLMGSYGADVGGRGSNGEVVLVYGQAGILSGNYSLNYSVGDVNASFYGEVNSDQLRFVPTGMATGSYYEHILMGAENFDDPGQMMSEGKAYVMLGEGGISAKCGDTLQANTQYILKNDTSTAGNCFNFTGDNIELDCRGYKITGPATTGTAFRVFPRVLRQNITIKNCFVQDFNYGVGDLGWPIFANSLFYNNIFNHTRTTTIHLGESTNANNNFTGNTFMNQELSTGYVFFLSYCDGTVLDSNNFINNAGYDIYTQSTSTGNKIQNNFVDKQNKNMQAFNFAAVTDSATLENNTLINIGTGANSWAYSINLIGTPITFEGTNLADGKNASEYYLYNKNNLVLDGLNHNGSEKVLNLGEFVASDCNNLTVINSNITNHASRNIYLNNVDNSNFSNNNMSRSISSSYYLFECPAIGCDNLTIADNDMSQKYSYGMHLYRSENARIQNNQITSTNGLNMLYINGGSGYLIENNNITGIVSSSSSYFGMEVTGSAVGHGHGVIRNNAIGGGYGGFYSPATVLTWFQNVSIYNNTFYRGYGYNIYLGSGNLFIYNNTLVKDANVASGGAVYFGGGVNTANHLFENNTIIGSPYAFYNGLTIRTNNLRIHNNHISNVNSFGFSFSTSGNTIPYARSNITQDNTVNGNPIYHYWNESDCPDLSNLDINQTRVSDLGIALVDMPDNCVIDNSTFVSNKGSWESGISLINTNYTNITNNYFYQVYHPIGFHWRDELAENVYIANNIFNDSASGIHYRTSGGGVSEKRDHTIYNNTFVGSDDYDIYKEDWTGITDRNDQTHIIGNTFISSQNYGIYFAYSDNNTIENNIFQNTPNYGIYFTQSANNIIKNNNFTSSQGSTTSYNYIYLTFGYTVNTTITGNYLNGSGYGINFASSIGTNNSVYNNQIYNAAQSAIYTTNANYQGIYNNTICYNKVPFASSNAAYTLSTIGWFENLMCVNSIIPANGTTVAANPPMVYFNVSNIVEQASTNCTAVFNGVPNGYNDTMGPDNVNQTIQPVSQLPSGQNFMQISCIDSRNDSLVFHNITFNTPLGFGGTMTTSETLTGNLTGSGDGVIIGANNIVLDCAGFFIDGDNTGVGIRVENRNNVQIINCNFSSGDFEYAINITNSTNVVIDISGASNVLIVNSSVTGYDFNNINFLNLETAWGKVKFIQSVTEAGSDLIGGSASDVRITYNSLFVDSANQAGFNVPGNVTLYGADFPRVQVSYNNNDYEFCSECTIFSRSPDLIFNVSHFTTYRGGGYLLEEAAWSNLAAVSGASVVSGDLNGDGFEDAVVTGSGGSGVYLNNKTALVLNASWGAITQVSFGSNGLADIDGDGDLDYLQFGQWNTFESYENTGSSLTLNNWLSGLSPVPDKTSMGLGDLDNDGDTDLVISYADGGSNPYTKVYLFTGSGFTYSAAWTAGLENVFDSSAYNGDRVVLADFDKDCDLDLLLFGEKSNGEKVGYFYKNIGSSFSRDITWETNLSRFSEAIIAVGDIDNNGTIDLVIAGKSYLRSDSCNMADLCVIFAPGECNLLLNTCTTSGFAPCFQDSDCSYCNAVGSPGGWPSCSTAMGGSEQNEDCWTCVGSGSPCTSDPQCWTETRLGWIYGNNGSAFIEKQSILSLYSGTAVLGDVDANGYLDLFLSGENSSGMAERVFYINNGSAFIVNNSWQENVLAYYKGVSSLFIDFNNDSRLDLGVIGPTQNKTDWCNQTNQACNSTYDYCRESGGQGWCEVTGQCASDGAPCGNLGGYDPGCQPSCYYETSQGFGCSQADNSSCYFCSISRNYGDCTNPGNPCDAYTCVNSNLSCVNNNQTCWVDTNTAEVYINNFTTANTRPSAPTGFNNTHDGVEFGLNWSGASDSETGNAGLYYNLRVGETSGVNDVRSGAYPRTSNPTTGYFGNVMNKDFINLTISKRPYYWAVQTIDPALGKSEWSSEQFYNYSVKCGNKAGDVTMFANVSADLGVCFNITTNGITVDCAGYTLIGNGSIGIKANGYDNLVIKNCVFENFSQDIVLDHSDNSVIYNTDVIINITNSSNDVVNSSDVDWLYLTNSINTLVVDSIVKNYTFDKAAYFAIENSTYGQLKFLQNVTGSGTDLFVDSGSDIYWDGRSVSVDTISQQTFNVSANISLYNVAHILPQQYVNISGNWTICTPTTDPSCYNLSYANQIYVFNVSHFSSFTGKEYSGLILNSSWSQSLPNVGLEGTVVLVDVDNDGDKDLHLTGYDANIFQYYNSVYENTGSTFSEFGVMAGILPGVAYSGAAWGDYDLDGDSDLVFCGEFAGLYYGEAWKSSNNLSSGMAQDAASSVNINNTWKCTMALGDINVDGYLDLAMSGQDSFGNPVCEVYSNQGGTFYFNDSLSSGCTGKTKGRTRLFDVNNDNYVDLVSMGEDAAGNLLFEVLINNNGTNLIRNATFEANLIGMTNGTFSYDDLDNDGLRDMIALGDTKNFGPRTIWYKNTGATFVEVSNHSMENLTLGSVCIVDFDTDGWRDVMIMGVDRTIQLGKGHTKIYTGSGDGTWLNYSYRYSYNLSTNGWGSCAVGEINNAQHIDVVTVGNEPDVLAEVPLTRIWTGNPDEDVQQGNDYPNAVGPAIVYQTGGEGDGMIEFEVTDGGGDTDGWPPMGGAKNNNKKVYATNSVTGARAGSPAEVASDESSTGVDGSFPVDGPPVKLIVSEGTYNIDYTIIDEGGLSDVTDISATNWMNEFTVDGTFSASVSGDDCYLTSDGSQPGSDPTPCFYAGSWSTINLTAQILKNYNVTVEYWLDVDSEYSWPGTPNNNYVGKVQNLSYMDNGLIVANAWKLGNFNTSFYPIMLVQNVSNTNTIHNYTVEIGKDISALTPIGTYYNTLTFTIWI